jgi:hypothetical protein
MKYFVSPAEKSATWSISADRLASALRNRCPGTRITTTADGEFHALEWVSDMAHGPLEGALNRDGQALILDGAIEDCAEVALWFRALVPEEQPLLFYDEAFNEDVELRSAMHVDELINPFLA